MGTYRVTVRARLVWFFWPLVILLGAWAHAEVAPPQTIRVVMDDAYVPYAFRSADGQLQGILPDQWRAWEKKTGIKSDIHAMDWAEALRRMQAGEFDVIDAIVETEERQQYFDFTPVYATVEVPIFFRGNISGITDLASLKGFPVGVKEGDQHIDKLQASGVTTLIPFPNFDAMIEAAKARKISVFVADAPAALYLLNKAGIEGEFRRSAPIFRDGLQRAVRKGDAAMLRLVSEGFASVEASELKQIDEKWFGDAIHWSGRYLTYAAYAAGAAIMLFAGLVHWNRTLRTRVLERTAALGESERRYLSLFENMAEAVVYLHVLFVDGLPQDARYLEVNPAWENLVGLKDVVGRKVSEVTPGLRETNADFFERISRVAGTGEPQRFEAYSGRLKKWLFVSAYCPRKEHVIVVLDDITQRKQMDDALRQSEFDLAEAQRIAQLGSWTLDVATNTVQGSEEFFRIFEIEKNAAGESYETFAALIHPDDLGRFETVAEEARFSGKPYEVEYRIKTRSGQKHIRAFGYARKDAAGMVITRFGITQDITKLKEAENHLRLVLNTIPAMVWTLRPDGSLDFLSQRWLEYTGLGLEEAIKNPNDCLHPEDLPKVVAEWGREMAAGRTCEHEMRLRRADGEYRWFLVRTVPMFDEQGRILKWYGTSTDIEDRKRAEKQSQVLIDAIPQEIWSGPPDGTLDFCNDRWRSYTGLTPETLRGEGWQAMLYPEDSERVLKAWHESVLHGIPYEQEERHRGADGTYRWFLARGVPLRDLKGRIVRWYGTNTDIEDRKQAEEQLGRYTHLLHFLSRRLFEVQEEERRHLARELHDEVSQALTAAKLNLKIIASDVPPAVAGRLADSIQILDRLLIQVRQISLDLRPPLLDELGLVPALRWLADQQAQRARLRITFTSNVESLDLDPPIRTACFRVAQEAITNAIRHAQAATVAVELRAEPDRVWLVVQDDGVGFDDGATQQRAAHGSSVGLLSMNERVSLLGGELTVNSVPGRGTEIRAWLPRSVVSPSPASA